MAPGHRITGSKKCPGSMSDLHLYSNFRPVFDHCITCIVCRSGTRIMEIKVVNQMIATKTFHSRYYTWSEASCVLVTARSVRERERERVKTETVVKHAVQCKWETVVTRIVFSGIIQAEKCRLYVHVAYFSLRSTKLTHHLYLRIYCGSPGQKNIWR